MRQSNLHQNKYIRKTSFTLFFIVVSFSVLMLGACGKKGALYLPSNPEPVTKTETQTVSPENTTDEDETKKKSSE